MTTLVDDDAREAIRNQTSRTLFVNAGAGSGKTSSLVDRVVTLVMRDGVPLRHVAAVTFTDKAGAELRDRLRADFERIYRDEDDTVARAAAADALDDLDSATIGTLHSFAQRILSQHPVEAGLPPLVEVLDEVASSVAFEERWAGIQTSLLDDPDVREPLLIGMALGVQLKHIRSLTLALGRDWDLIAERVLTDEDAPLHVPDLDAFIERAHQVVARREHCNDGEDKLLAKLELLDQHLERLDTAPDLESRLTHVRAIGTSTFRQGRKGSWAVDIQDVRDEAGDVADDAARIVASVLNACLRSISRWAGRQVLAAAEARRRDGRLEFHDLLVITRDVLRRHADVRSALHDRYQRLLLDEFQDTDPIQIEMAVRIAGGSDADAADWRDATIPEGRLFVVGDSKQSIYRFRRASIATYLEAESRIGGRETLSTNFRTVAPVLDWVNTVFGALIQPVSDAQPSYEPLAADRTEAATTGPSVTVLGAEAHTDLPRAAASVLRERESADVAAAIHIALTEGWQVQDRKTGKWRAATRQDIVVLVPARTSLPFLEEALERAQIPYRAEASSLVYQAAEVRDLLACARAIADATDALSLVTALRSPLFGCGDDDLWGWKRARGSFSIYSSVEDEAVQNGPVGRAITYLKKLSFEVRWMTPNDILTRIIADRRMYELAATGPHARDAWRRLRFVVDQSRAWTEVSGGGLRSYLAWAAHQGQEASRVAEAVLPETDVDAVRIMTIHAAKGLEFPIVILSGMTAQANSPSGVRLLWTPDGGYSVKVGKSLQTEDFEIAAPIDEQMDQYERVRLLYVATTRARDHLVVSLHRQDDSNRQTAARLMADAGGATAGSPFHLPPTPVPSGGEPQREIGAPLPDEQQWRSGIELARANAATPSAVSASGLEGTAPTLVLSEPGAATAGQAKGARDLELPPWSKGRYGSAIGRAVHGVLQVIDLATGDGLEDAVRSQVAAEGLHDQEVLVRSLVQSALDSELVKRAAVREHWRETYVGFTQLDGIVLEGYVDLIFREDDGTLVIVDYKTDAVPAGGIDSRVEFYRPQLEGYRIAVESAGSAGVTVTATLLFLHPEESVAVGMQATR